MYRFENNSLNIDQMWAEHGAAVTEPLPDGVVDSADPNYWMPQGMGGESPEPVATVPVPGEAEWTAGHVREDKVTIDVEGYIDSGTFEVGSGEWTPPSATHVLKEKLASKGYDVECCGGCEGCSGSGLGSRGSAIIDPEYTPPSTIQPERPGARSLSELWVAREIVALIQETISAGLSAPIRSDTSALAQGLDAIGGKLSVAGFLRIQESLGLYRPPDLDMIKAQLDTIIDARLNYGLFVDEREFGDYIADNLSGANTSTATTATIPCNCECKAGYKKVQVGRAGAATTCEAVCVKVNSRFAPYCTASAKADIQGYPGCKEKSKGDCTKARPTRYDYKGREMVCRGIRCAYDYHRRNPDGIWCPHISMWCYCIIGCPRPYKNKKPRKRRKWDEKRIPLQPGVDWGEIAVDIAIGIAITAALGGVLGLAVWIVRARKAGKLIEAAHRFGQNVLSRSG